MFKHLFRSKGFIWLANTPGLFFEWSSAAINLQVGIGGPWVCTLNEDLPKGDIGDRSQNLIFIGQEMKQQKDLILAEMDKCLVTEEEWDLLQKQDLTLPIEDDPFKKA